MIHIDEPYDESSAMLRLARRFDGPTGHVQVVSPADFDEIVHQLGARVIWEDVCGKTVAKLEFCYLGREIVARIMAGYPTAEERTDEMVLLRKRVSELEKEIASLRNRRCDAR